MTSQARGPGAPPGPPSGTLELLPPHSSPRVGWALQFVGLFGLAIVARDAAGGAVAGAAGPAALALMVAIVGRMLATPTGGLSVDLDADAVIIHRRGTERVAIPRRAIAAIRMPQGIEPSAAGDAPDAPDAPDALDGSEDTADTDGQAGDAAAAGAAGHAWPVELRLHGGGVVLVGESAEASQAEALGAALAEALRCPREGLEAPLMGSEPTPPATAWVRPGPGGLALRVGWPWALGLELTALGLAALAIGGALLAAVAREPIGGFLLGPPAGLLGLLLIGTTALKAVAWEEIEVGPTAIAHAFRLGRTRLAERRIERTGGEYARLRPLGTKGLALEIVGGERGLIAAAGIRPRSAGVDPERALALAAWLTARLAAQGAAGSP